MHFCKFNLTFLGLGYKPDSTMANYSFSTFELYKCKKCGKLIFFNEKAHSHTFMNMYEDGIRAAVDCGYEPIGALVERDAKKKI